MRPSLSRPLVVGMLAACGAAQPGASRCPVDRVMVLAGQDEVARLAGCERALGVTIRTGAALDLAPLHALREITGDLVIGPTVGTDEVALPGLVRVGGAIRIASNGSLTGVFAPRLARAGSLVLDGNAALTTVAMPRLAAIDGALAISDAPSLEVVDVTDLQTIGGDLAIRDARKLAVLEVPQLAHAGAVRIGATSLSAAQVALLANLPRPQ